MVAAKCGLPKDLADSQPAAHLTINGPASVFAFLIPLRNTLYVMYLGFTSGKAGLFHLSSSHTSLM